MKSFPVYLKMNILMLSMKKLFQKKIADSKVLISF